MEILIIHGSPRKGRHTDRVIEAFLNHQNHKEHHVYLYNMNIQHCIGCLYCAKKGICFMDDDMKTLYDLFESVDYVVLGSPMYFNSITSMTKTMIDRTQVYWSRKFALGTGITVEKQKKGTLILTTGVAHDKASSVAAIKVVDIFFKAINCTLDEIVILDNMDQNPVVSDDMRLSEVGHIGRAFFT